MTDTPLLQRIRADLKTSVLARNRLAATTLRMLLAAIKKREIDEQVTLDETQLIAVTEKEIKQRHEAAELFQAAGRTELATKEQQESKILQNYLPEQLSDTEIEAIITQAITETNATTMRDMGKLMATIRPKLQGRADMGKVSAIVKTKLAQ